MENCIICSTSDEKDNNLVQCKTAKPWARVYCAAEVWQFTPILELSNGKNDFPRSLVKCRMSCRKEFVNQKKIQSLLKENYRE